MALSVTQRIYAGCCICSGSIAPVGLAINQIMGPDPFILGPVLLAIIVCCPLAVAFGIAALRGRLARPLNVIVWSYTLVSGFLFAFLCIGLAFGAIRASLHS